MNQIETFEPQVEKIEKFQTLQAGMYWRSIQPIPDEGIEQNTVLLLQSVRSVDNVPHTIILRPHPSKFGTTCYLDLKDKDGTPQRSYFKYDEHRFRVDDFLRLFEFEPNHQERRNQELVQLQQKVNDIQLELQQGQSNPRTMAAIVDQSLAEMAAKEAKLNKDDNATSTTTTLTTSVERQHIVSVATGSIANALETGITSEKIQVLKDAAKREHTIATIKSNWIKKKTGEIASVLQSMTPFYEEQAAAALAQTQDVQAYVVKLIEGIASLGLYVGENVEVNTIRTGASAPKNVPLSFIQKKLLMDEELAVWADVDENFDFSSQKKFMDALINNHDLVNQIFPTERCILVMATTRRHIDYGDKFTNERLNQLNRVVFLMARDGDNIHQIYSPVESHLGADKLFPSKSDQNNIFRGINGSNINFDDVAYTDKLASHERFALHYKRFLLLVCGLDHRLKLFGEFYDGPPTFEFVSMQFQEDNCRFVHDDDGQNMLPGKEHVDVKTWIAQKNAYLRSGSRLLCNWNALMTPHSAPSACKEERSRNSNYFDKRYFSATSYSIVVAYRSGEDVCVDVDVTGETRGTYEKRSFTCKVNVSQFKPNWYAGTEDLPYLCLDAVTPEELSWYIHNRSARVNHVTYIRCFKMALKFIAAEREAEALSREQLYKALADGNIATGTEAHSIIEQSVIAWRAENRGATLPDFTTITDVGTQKAWKELLNQMFILAGKEKDQVKKIEDFVRSLGYEPLRFVLSGKSKLIVYAAPNSEEIDDRYEKHAWVHKITIARNKSGYVEKSRRWDVMPKSTASETTVHEWDHVSEWIRSAEIFASYESKKQICDQIQPALTNIKKFIEHSSEKDFLALANEWRENREWFASETGSVNDLTILIPFALTYNAYYKRLEYVCVANRYTPYILYKLAPTEKARNAVYEMFLSLHSHKEGSAKVFQRTLNKEHPWELRTIFVNKKNDPIDFYHQHFFAWEGNQLEDNDTPWNPLLSIRFNNWKEGKRKSSRDRFTIEMAPGITNQENSDVLVLDDLFENKLPENYDPHIVQVYRFMNPEMYDACIDLVPVGDRTESSFRSFHSRDNPFENAPHNYTKSYSISTDFFATKETAMQFVQQRKNLLNAKDLSDVSQAKSGIERWYTLAKKEEISK